MICSKCMGSASVVCGNTGLCYHCHNENTHTYSVASATHRDIERMLFRQARSPVRYTDKDLCDASTRGLLAGALAGTVGCGAAVLTLTYGAVIVDYVVRLFGG